MNVANCRPTCQFPLVTQCLGTDPLILRPLEEVLLRVAKAALHTSPLCFRWLPHQCHLANMHQSKELLDRESYHDHQKGQKTGGEYWLWEGNSSSKIRRESTHGVSFHGLSIVFNCYLIFKCFFLFLQCLGFTSVVSVRVYYSTLVI